MRRPAAARESLPAGETTRAFVRRSARTPVTGAVPSDPPAQPESQAVETSGLCHYHCFI